MAAWRRLAGRHSNIAVGLALVLVIAGLSAGAPLLSRPDPTAADMPNQLHRPSRVFPLGTDHLGRDLFARVLYGGRVTLLIGLAVVLLTAAGGAGVGLAAGMSPSMDRWMMRVMDALLALPAILLAIAAMTILGRSVLNVVVALAISSMPRMARLVRGSALVLREGPMVEAARAIGAGTRRILIRHILPNVVSPIVVQGTYTFSTAVLTEASLSFLGVGPAHGVPSWGSVLSEGRDLIDRAPWMTIFPGIAIVVTVLGINLLGDGLRDALDPQLRGL